MQLTAHVVLPPAPNAFAPASSGHRILASRPQLAADHADESGAQNAIGECLQGGRCDGITSRVAKIDVDSLNADEIIRYPSNDLFILGTVAIQVDDEIWLGGIGGRDRIARFSVP